MAALQRQVLCLSALFLDAPANSAQLQACWWLVFAAYWLHPLSSGLLLPLIHEEAVCLTLYLHRRAISGGCGCPPPWQHLLTRPAGTCLGIMAMQDIAEHVPCSSFLFCGEQASVGCPAGHILLHPTWYGAMHPSMLQDATAERERAEHERRQKLKQKARDKERTARERAAAERKASEREARSQQEAETMRQKKAAAAERWG